MHGKIHPSQPATAVCQTMRMQLVRSDRMAYNKRLAYFHQTKYVYSLSNILTVVAINLWIFSHFQVKPNLDSRIDPSESTAGNSPTGFFGIQTSSFSSSSDVNGIKKHKEGATTTINDNGKVSSYTLENWSSLFSMLWWHISYNLI